MRHRLISARCHLTAVFLIAFCLGAAGCRDSASISEKAVEVPLSSLAITPPGTLQPAFSSNTTSYTAAVPTAVTSVTVPATLKDRTTTTMTINGALTASGEGQPISLGQPGSTTSIHITVMTQTGLESVYTVTVTRLVSSDDDLSSLRVNAGSLDPAFAPETTTYAVNVATGVTEVTVSATKSDPDAVMSGSVLAGTGQASGQATIPLGGPGTTTPVSISVTAPSGILKTYSLTINRLFSNDSNLSAISAKAGVDTAPLEPAFAPDTLSYTVNVGLLVGSVTITATKSDPNAVMSALGAVIAAGGIPAGTVTLSPGLGTNPPVDIIVIAQDGVARKTYSIAVTRGLF